MARTREEISRKRKISMCEPEPPTKRCRVDLAQVTEVTETTSNPPSSINTSRAEFEAKYVELDKLGEGGFGSVYSGERKRDHLPVAIKHIPKASVKMARHGQMQEIPEEVLFMQMVAGGPESVGESAPVSLLDWYDLGEDVLLVMERPVPCVDLFDYLTENGPLSEDQAKNIMKQMVDACLKMHANGVFHRDIKLENILVETSSAVPRVRIIDFGCGCLVSEGSYHHYAGTKEHAPPEFSLEGKYQAGPTTVWQLGALLYELLDGFHRFNIGDFMTNDILQSQLSEDCLDFLRGCVRIRPVDRATLLEMERHRWLS